MYRQAVASESVAMSARGKRDPLASSPGRPAEATGAATRNLVLATVAFALCFTAWSRNPRAALAYERSRRAG